MTALVFESSGQALDVGRFARPIDALKTNEKPSFCHANFVNTPVSPNANQTPISVKHLFCLCAIPGLAGAAALVAIDGGIVCFQRFAKCATSIPARYEIQRIAGIGVQGGTQRIASRH